jgi:CRISPR-associated protein Cmr6
MTNHRQGGDKHRPNDRQHHIEQACIRSVLCALDPTPTTHSGLWLDRFLPQQPKTATKDEDKGIIQAHIKRLGDIKVPYLYRFHLKRWQDHLQDLGANVRQAKAEVRGRMIIGLGAESVLETAIHLHHTYGVPVIPGSALKGLAASYARNRLTDESWRKQPQEGDGTNLGASYRALFGDTTEAGCVTFHDALWIPPEGEDKDKLPLDLDVMTVHHRDYYGKKGQKPPADSDDPNPVSFVTAHGTYLIALEGPPDWTDAAMSMLKRALAEEGIGAKTAAGYGRLDLNYNSPAEEARKAQELAAKEAHEAQERAAEEARKAKANANDKIAQIQQIIAKIHGGNANSQVPHILNQIRSLPSEEQPRLALECIRQLDEDRKNVHKKALKDGKSWALELAQIRGVQP